MTLKKKKYSKFLALKSVKFGPETKHAQSETTVVRHCIKGEILRYG